MIEATAVERIGRITHGCLGLWDDATEASLARVLAAARRVAHRETKFGIQLAHAGRKASAQRPWEGGRCLAMDADPWTTVSASAIPFDGDWHVPVELDQTGIERIKQAFVEAARRAMKLGIEVIEIHAAHGYLLHQFTSPMANHRTDEYGGNREGRHRLPVEIVKAVREAVGDSPVGVGARITGTDWAEGGITIEDTRPQPPGYWWLASEWSNLLPSCSDCNRPRRQDFPGGLPRTAGKANRFPIASEAKRAAVPGQEAKERRLLLHPSLDQPEEHLHFVSGAGTIRDGEIEPARLKSGRASKMGEASIEVYALQRLGLIERRRTVLRELNGHLTRALELKDAAIRHPNDRKFVDNFRAAVSDIVMFTAPEHEYAAMCRQVVAQFAITLFQEAPP